MWHTLRGGEAIVSIQIKRLCLLFIERLASPPENSLRINSFMETVQIVTRLKSEVVAGVGLGKVLRHGAGEGTIP